MIKRIVFVFRQLEAVGDTLLYASKLAALTCGKLLVLHANRDAYERIEGLVRVYVPMGTDVQIECGNDALNALRPTDVLVTSDPTIAKQRRACMTLYTAASVHPFEKTYNSVLLPFTNNDSWKRVRGMMLSMASGRGIVLAHTTWSDGDWLEGGPEAHLAVGAKMALEDLKQQYPTAKVVLAVAVESVPGFIVSTANTHLCGLIVLVRGSYVPYGGTPDAVIDCTNIPVLIIPSQENCS